MKKDVLSLFSVLKHVKLHIDWGGGNLEYQFFSSGVSATGPVLPPKGIKFICAICGKEIPLDKLKWYYDSNHDSFVPICSELCGIVLSLGK